MSLKYVHAFLISCSILLSVGFGIWTFAVPQAATYQSYGYGSFVIAVLLIGYLIRYFFTTFKS